MKYIMILALVALVGCNEEENASADYVENQKAKVVSALQQKSNLDDQPKLITATAVEGNRLYSQDVVELRKVYANPKGRNCITFSNQLLGETSKAGYNTPDQKHLQQSCQQYSKQTPYSFAEIIDPKAISNFEQETLRASCEEQEKQVDGRFIKRAKVCEKFFGSANK